MNVDLFLDKLYSGEYQVFGTVIVKNIISL